MTRVMDSVLVPLRWHMGTLRQVVAGIHAALPQAATAVAEIIAVWELQNAILYMRTYLLSLVQVENELTFAEALKTAAEAAGEDVYTCDSGSLFTCPADSIGMGGCGTVLSVDGQGNPTVIGYPSLADAEKEMLDQKEEAEIDSAALVKQGVPQNLIQGLSNTSCITFKLIASVPELGEANKATLWVFVDRLVRRIWRKEQVPRCTSAHCLEIVQWSSTDYRKRRFPKMYTEFWDRTSIPLFDPCNAVLTNFGRQQGMDPGQIVATPGEQGDGDQDGFTESDAFGDRFDEDIEFIPGFFLTRYYTIHGLNSSHALQAHAFYTSYAANWGFVLSCPYHDYLATYVPLSTLQKEWELLGAPYGQDCDGYGQGPNTAYGQEGCGTGPKEEATCPPDGEELNTLFVKSDPGGNIASWWPIYTTDGQAYWGTINGIAQDPEKWWVYACGRKVGEKKFTLFKFDRRDIDDTPSGAPIRIAEEYKIPNNG